jgi:hypothetical protein
VTAIAAVPTLAVPAIADDETELRAALEHFREAAAKRDALAEQVEALKTQLRLAESELGQAGVGLEDAALAVYAVKPAALQGLAEKLEFHATVTTSSGLRRSAERRRVLDVAQRYFAGDMRDDLLLIMQRQGV